MRGHCLVVVLVLVAANAVRALNGEDEGSGMKWTRSADDEKCGDNLVWSMRVEDGTLFINGTGDMYNFSESGIAPWHSNCSAITKVEIADGVTSIGEKAFFQCGLESVIIPSSVRAIGASAFIFCKNLKEVVIPSGVKAIEKSTFGGCSALTDVIIPQSVTSIGNNAFFGCANLANISIPRFVQSIGAEAFSSCSSLASISIPFGVQAIQDRSFKECKSLKEVFIPSSVKSIGQEAFASCGSLNNVLIPSNVTSIMSQAFFNCTALNSVHFLGKTTMSASDVFSGCNLTVLCGPPDFDSESFGGFNITTESCSTFHELFNCFELAYINGTLVQYKKAEVIEWEKRSNECATYICDNASGMISQNKCNSTGSNPRVCVKGQCIERDDERIGVAIELQGIDLTEVDSDEILKVLSDKLEIRSDEVVIAYETDVDIIRVIVYVKDEQTAIIIADAFSIIVRDCLG